MFPVSSSKPQHSIYVLTTRTLVRVFNGQPLETALERYREHTHYRQLSFLCFQTLRHYYSLSERVNSCLTRDSTTLDREVWVLLLIGACQLQYSSIPRGSCVNALVESIKQLGKTSASSLINAVLRKYEPAIHVHKTSSVYELPDWITKKIQTEMPQHALSILESNTRRAPMTLRINTSMISPQEFCTLLSRREIEFTNTVLPNAINLNSPQPMHTLPGFKEGFFVTQDLSSQLAVPLLQPTRTDKILDACAFPGVKTRQIIDLYPNHSTYSVDIKANCSTWNIAALGDSTVRHKFIQADLTDTNELDGMRFQRILLDVPCSGSGTMRRHPDLKLHCSPGRVKNGTVLQGKLMRKLWELLDPNGWMIYTTCSIFNDENDRIINDFVDQHDNVLVEPLKLPYGFSTSWGWQTFPTEAGYDGFYLCKLRKTAD